MRRTRYKMWGRRLDNGDLEVFRFDRDWFFLASAIVTLKAANRLPGKWVSLAYTFAGTHGRMSHNVRP